jgi:hypothetical protein
MLPILEGDLLKLINMFPYETHGWLVGKSTGVTTTSLTLQIYNRAQKIKVCLCNDMKANLTSGTVKFEYLRFHLCLQDAKDICDETKPCHKVYEWLLEEYIYLVREAINAAIPCRWRTHALLGQSILSKSKLTTVQQRIFQVCYVTAFFPQLDLLKVQEFSDYVVSTPNNFDDLEDDDNIGADKTSHFRDFGEVRIG